jgi:hypothetical protein
MQQSVLDELQQWYAARCDGDWEHHHGVHIGNLDNPGWMVTIDLTGTALENTPFTEVRDQYEDELDWMICQKRGSQFVGNGGPRKLEAILRVFLGWAKTASEPA